MVSSRTVELTPATSVLQKEIPADYSALLLLPVAAIAVHQYTKKQMRKAGRKMMWQLVKMKIKSLFSFKKDKGNGKGIKLLLILLGLGFIAAIGIFLSWSIAITLLVVGGLIAIIYSAKD
jgi:hypothetical protein